VPVTVWWSYEIKIRMRLCVCYYISLLRKWLKSLEKDVVSTPKEQLKFLESQSPCYEIYYTIVCTRALEGSGKARGTMWQRRDLIPWVVWVEGKEI
jgi:hypothetical protein